MDAKEIEEYIRGLERRVEILGNENAALAMTMNKLMMENMKLKSEVKSLQKEIADLHRPTPERVVKFD
jgi:regulator of replication initiation timing